MKLSALPADPVTRFAPSPTGLLHLGHLLNAIYTWGIARRLGGRVVLRLEDHDRDRSRPEYERAILDTLEWFGFEPDLGTVAEFRNGTTRFRQSDNVERYREAARSLGARTYWCGCSRKDIGPADAGSPEARYPGTCRDRELAGRGDRGLRLRLDDTVEEFVDARHGLQRQCPADQCGDLLVRDRHGNWTYQFAVSVDDLDQGITLVVRGDDLLASTGRQLAVARILGRRDPPLFVHHPLLVDPTGRKLAKRDGSTGLAALRSAGHSAADVLGRAAHLGGLITEFRPLSVGELPQLISIG